MHESPGKLLPHIKNGHVQQDYACLKTLRRSEMFRKKCCKKKKKKTTTAHAGVSMDMHMISAHQQQRRVHVPRPKTLPKRLYTTLYSSAQYFVDKPFRKQKQETKGSTVHVEHSTCAWSHCSTAKRVYRTICGRESRHDMEGIAADV